VQSSRGRLSCRSEIQPHSMPTVFDRAASAQTRGYGVKLPSGGQADVEGCATSQ